MEESSAGFRKQGVVLRNEQTQQTVYTPPDAQQIEGLMANLERFINDESVSDIDTLIKMAIIHHQFESIHPFYDGNGRTGRIINILYLVKQGLLNNPVLYLSRYINQHKNDYYRLLQKVRDSQSWEEWILFILEGVVQTSYQIIALIHGMRDLMQAYKDQIREKLPRIYSQDLVNNLFRHPYTKIEFLTNELGVHYNTSARYLDELVRVGIVTKYKIRKENYYLNSALFELLRNVHTLHSEE